jgi:hypothetical protein
MDINARQIESLDFNYLDQSETYQYSVDQLARVKASAAIMAKLGTEVGAWEVATQAFDAAFRKASTVGQTKTVKAIDDERDSLYSGFTGTVNNATKSPLEAQRTAANDLLEPIKRYGVNTSGEYQQQTMRTEQLCLDLLTNFTSQLNALGLTAWVEALQAKNHEFQESITARTNDQANFVKSELSQLRQQIIAAYRNFVKLMNVVLIYEGDSAYATTIDQLNAEVRHYKQIIARKGGGSSSGGGSNNGGGGSNDNGNNDNNNDNGNDNDNNNDNNGGGDNPTPDPTPDPNPNPNPGGGGDDDGADED